LWLLSQRIDTRLAERRNRGRKFESSAPHRADVTLVIAAISEDSPRRFNAAIDGALRNQPASPNPVHDFFPADHTALTAQQEEYEIEDERLGVQHDAVSS
jgi:hypothetical protein